MHHFLVSCFVLLPLLGAVLKAHNSSANLIENHTPDCNHIECPTLCPADSYLKSILDDYEDADDETNLSDYNENDYDSFESNDEGILKPIQHASHYADEFSDHHSKTEHRRKRNVLHEDQFIQCCGHNECACRKCDEIPKCPEGEVAVLKHKGQGIPGNCCSIYECTIKEDCSNGPSKQTYWRTSCKECRCFGEMELCTNHCPEEELLRNCYSDYWHKPFMNGARWNEGSCITCTCRQGEKRCLAPICPHLQCKEFIHEKNVCCPKCKEEKTIHQNTKENEVITKATENFTTANPLNLTINIKESIQHITNVPLSTVNLKTIHTTEASFLKEESGTTISEENSLMSSKELTHTSSSTLEPYTKPTWSTAFSATSDDNQTTQNYSTIVTTTTTFIPSTQKNVIQFTTNGLPSNMTSVQHMDSLKFVSKLKDFLNVMSTYKSTTPISTISTNKSTMEATPTTPVPTTTLPLVKTTSKDILVSSTQTTENSIIKNDKTFNGELSTSSDIVTTQASSIILTSTTLSTVLDYKSIANIEQYDKSSVLFNGTTIIILICLFLASIICTTLGLIIRYTRNRKKMYSSIPNSETSLSKTSTKTMLTV